MTDNEIIKALECCKELICKDCPIFPNSTPVLLCKSRLEIEALDLIKRQQAEIERLSKPQGVTFLANGIEIHAKDSDEYYKFKRLVKAEAITEFAEKLKDMHKHNTTSVVSLVTLFGDINKMVKEMTEDINDT